MPLWRKRPILVDAEQFTIEHRPRGVMRDQEGYFVTTIQGSRVSVHYSDWIIKESVKDESLGFYPCANEVFRVTYEPDT